MDAHQLELIRIENTPDSEKEHPRSIASIRRANTSEIRDDENYGSKSKSDYHHPTSIANLCPPSSSASKIHLICSWRAILGQQVVQGENYLRGIPIRPLTFFRGCPITATVKYASSISHNFSISPALVRVEVTLKNRMIETSVKFSMSWTPTSTFELIGTCEQNLELVASEEVTVPFEALIPKAGVHNLQALKLIVRHEQEEDKIYNLSQQWLINVVDSSSTGPAHQ